MSYLGYIEGLARVSFKDCGATLPGTKAHLYRGTFREVGEPLCPKGWRMGVVGDISIFRENSPDGICLACIKKAVKLGWNPDNPGADRTGGE